MNNFLSPDERRQVGMAVVIAALSTAAAKLIDMAFEKYLNRNKNKAEEKDNKSTDDQ